MSTSEAIPSATASAASSELHVPSQYRAVGVVLAVASGVLIGSSFVFKKKGLLQSQAGKEAGVGVDYLKNALWWFGMTLMILGEICNFAAYAFTEAIIVTPLGALSVVICAILSSFFLNERLTLFGWIGCFQCIVGSVIIALNGPKEQSVSTIAEFKKLFLAPGFLAFGSVIIVASLIIIFYFAPRYGQKNMLWYILVCSLIGGLSVSCTQGLGASIVTSIRGHNQFKNWFIYFLLGFVVVTLLTEIYFLNMALALFNTAMVTPTYYVIFTFCTLATSVILYQGLNSSVTEILTVVLGFLTICSGITLLQMSKVDPTKLEHKLVDRRTTILLKAAKEEVQVPGISDNPEKEVEMTEEPGLDALRGTFGIGGTIVRARRRSTIGGGTHSGIYPGSLNAPSSPGIRARPNTATSIGNLSVPGPVDGHDLEKAMTAPSPGSSPPSSPRYHWFRRTGSGPRKQRLSASGPPASPSRQRSATLDTDAAGRALTVRTHFSVPEEDEGADENGLGLHSKEPSMRTLLLMKDKEKQALRRSKSSPQRRTPSMPDDVPPVPTIPRIQVNRASTREEGPVNTSSPHLLSAVDSGPAFMTDATTTFDSPDEIPESEKSPAPGGGSGSKERQPNTLTNYFDAPADARPPSVQTSGGGDGTDRGTFSSEAHLLGNNSNNRHTAGSSIAMPHRDNIPSIVMDTPKSQTLQFLPPSRSSPAPPSPQGSRPSSSAGTSKP